MIIAHLADLHLGKNVYGYSMIEDQKYILNEILEILKEENVQTVLISGDVYDRSDPSAEAMVLLDHFLSDLQKEGYEIFVIAGNHDSGDRLAYGSKLLSQMNVHIAGNYHGTLLYTDMQDEYGTVRFHLLPFIRPADVNRYRTPDQEKAGNYNEALKMILSSASIGSDRNVILSHQFVTGSQVDENGSEELSIGGVDQVNGHLYDAFDYVALGHIHRPQKLLRDTMRYAGTPLKYSFSEVNQTKSIPVIHMKERGNTEVRLVPLKPLHEMCEIHGMFEDIMKNDPTDDYMHITLNDEEDVPDAVRQLKKIYPDIMRLDYDNTRTRSAGNVNVSKKIEKQDPEEIFREFYELRNGRKMSEEQEKISAKLMREAWNGKEES